MLSEEQVAAAAAKKAADELLSEKVQSTLLSTAEAPFFDENHTFVATCICICLLGHVFTRVLLVLHVVWLRSWVQCGWCSVL